jgi:hypothetical protein
LVPRSVGVFLDGRGGRSYAEFRFEIPDWPTADAVEGRIQ